MRLGHSGQCDICHRRRMVAAGWDPASGACPWYWESFNQLFRLLFREDSCD